jgi:hypothetical protein
VTQNRVKFMALILFDSILRIKSRGVSILGLMFKSKEPFSHVLRFTSCVCI